MDCRLSISERYGVDRPSRRRPGTGGDGSHNNVRNRERLPAAARLNAGNLGLEGVKLGLIPQIELVHQDSRALVRVRIFDRIIHTLHLILAVAAADRSAVLVRSQAFRALQSGALLHRVGEMDALHRADLGVGSTPDHLAAGLGRCPRFLLLGHGSSLARIMVACSLCLEP